MTSEGFLKKRQLPKLMACMTKTSLENLRNKALFNLDTLDAKGIRRMKFPLHECLIMELREAGYAESSNYLQDLIYDNMQLVADDDIGIVVDLRKRSDYLEHISSGLQKAEKERDKGNTKKECLGLLKLAMYYAEQGKGILWLAEKFFLAAIAVASQYLLDGGRQKACCKYHYAKFLLDKFPGSDPEEPFLILTEVRDNAIGKDWPLYEPTNDEEAVPPDTVFSVTAIQLHRVLLDKARAIRKKDTAKAERLSRLAERRANDAGDINKTAEAIIEIGICQLIMNNLNNAQKTFERAFKIHSESKNVDGLCETRMHLAAVMQKLGNHEMAAKLLTEMGALAMEYCLRRQLGRALHLLGELHLRRERPELGTQHLAEAFSCFMGTSFQKSSMTQFDIMPKSHDDEKGDFIFKSPTNEIYEEEAEQSRLMMAISAVFLWRVWRQLMVTVFPMESAEVVKNAHVRHEKAPNTLTKRKSQELMASYFNLLRDAGACAIAQTKTIEWKLTKAGWWVRKKKHDFIPCLCKKHNRTPLDILRLQLNLIDKHENTVDEFSERDMTLGRTDTVDDIRKLRSSYRDRGKFSEIEVQDAAD